MRKRIIGGHFQYLSNILFIPHLLNLWHYLKFHYHKMAVKSKSGIYLQSFHYRKARAVRITEILIFEFQKNLPCLLFVFIFYGNNAHKSTILKPLPKILGNTPSETASDKGYSFIKYKIRCQKRDFVVCQKMFGFFVVGVFFINNCIPCPCINKQSFHFFFLFVDTG